MTNPHGSFIWYELITPDPDSSAQFYGAVIGWTVGDQPPGDFDYRMIQAADGTVGGMLRLTEAMAVGGGRPGWLGYIGVDDVDATLARLVTAGGSVLMQATDMPGVGRLALVTDPQGVAFYLMRGASDDASHAFAPDRIGHCAWNELVTTDQVAALAVYGDVFGWVADGAMPMGDMGDYTFLSHDGRQIGAVMTAPAGASPQWNYYFHVTDIAGAPTRIRTAGGSVVHGPTDVPGGSQIVLGIDPLGASFALVGQGDGLGGGAQG